MPLTAVKPSQIRKIAANSLVGNNTGAEARGTSLSASQVRTLLGLGTTSDVTFDIVRATTSVQTPLVNNASAALTLGNATYGVTVPGDITVGTKVTPALNMDSSGTTNNEGPVIRFQKNGANKWAWFMPASSLNCELYGFNASANAISVTPTNDITLGAALTVPATATIGASTVAALNLNSSGTTSAQGAILRLQKNGSPKWGVWMPADTENFGIYNHSTASYAMSVTPAGAATFSGDISMSKTSAQGYIYAYNSTGAAYASLFQDATNTNLTSSSGGVSLGPANGFIYGYSGVAVNHTLRLYEADLTNYTTVSSGALSRTAGNVSISGVGGSFSLNSDGIGRVQSTTGRFAVFKSGVNATVEVYDTSNAKYSRLTHDGTNGILTTSSGNLNLVPTGGTVAVTGGITASGLIKGLETTSTPSGTTQTITLETGNCQTLDLTSSTGDVTATLTVPANSARGSLLIKQHAATSRDITWAASSGTITWLGTEPTWNADATSSFREVEWRFNGTNTFLAASGSS